MGQTTAGTILGVSLTLPATEDEAGYEALTLIPVGELTDIGQYGRLYEEVTSRPLAERRVRKYKGTYDEGSPSLTYDRVGGDAGQEALKSALALDTNAAFGVTHQDGSIDYFSAKVMSLQNGGLSADSMYTGEVNLGIDSDIIEVAAPATP